MEAIMATVNLKNRVALSPRETAELLGVTINTMRTWLQEGNLPHTKVGGRVLVSAEAVAKLFEKQE
jgi:excisionase family DNA binding protein